MTERIAVMGENGFVSEPEIPQDHEEGADCPIDSAKNIDGAQPPGGTEQEKHEPKSPPPKKVPGKKAGKVGPKATLEPAPDPEPTAEPSEPAGEEPAAEDAPRQGRTRNVLHNVWPEVYSSRQNRSILKWPVVAVEEHTIRTKEGPEKVLCLAVGKDRVKGIVPFPEAGVKPGQSKAINRAKLAKYIGQEVAFIVIGIDVENDRFIASRKAALDRLSARVWPSLKAGMVITATARRVYDNAVIVEFDGIEARLPIYEISYGWVDEMLNYVQPGDELGVQIIELDRENERVIVSLKALIPNPWPGALDRYQTNGIYLGAVTGVMDYGVFVELEPGVNSLCNHLRTTSKYSVGQGDQVAVRVSDVSLNGSEGRVKGGIVRVVRKHRIS